MRITESNDKKAEIFTHSMGGRKMLNWQEFSQNFELDEDQYLGTSVKVVKKIRGGS
jgi:hypothetical protein